MKRHKYDYAILCTRAGPVILATITIFINRLATAPKWLFVLFVVVAVSTLIAAFYSSFRKVVPTEFVTKLSSYIGEAFADLLYFCDLKKECTDENYKKITQSILDDMTNIVGHLVGDRGNYGLSTCLMLLLPTNHIVNKNIRFLQSGRSMTTYEGLLAVDLYCKKGVRAGLPNIVIPFDKANGKLENQLPGAPYALHQRSPYLVSDTLSLKHDKHQGVPGNLWDEISKYFEENQERLRTFIAFPLWIRNQRLGVVNINASEPRLFDALAESISDLVTPYIPQLCFLTDNRINSKDIDKVPTV